MPDFNKGDFTQQGVAGHVNANLRLNEKRLVNIDMTSNEEAEGCTITGTVTDLLNDKVYNIGSGGGGGGGEQTETFTLIQENDYTSELSNNDNLIFDICIGNFEEVSTTQIIVNINNTDVVFTPIVEGGVAYASADNQYELSTSHGGYLLVPTAGTYHVKSNITLTGPAITVQLGEPGQIKAFLGSDIYTYRFPVGSTGEMEIIADGLIPYASGQ